MIVCDRLGDMLQHHRFARPRCGDDQAALAFADWGQQIHYARGVVVGLAFQAQALIRI